MMKRLLLTALLILFMTVSCGFLDLNKGEKLSEDILSSLKKGGWEFIRENSSKAYMKKNPDSKFNGLKKWVTNELGRIISYKKLLLYTGSDLRIPGENYITAAYELHCTKGKAEIEIVIVREEGKYRIYRLDFSKKPSF